MTKPPVETYLPNSDARRVNDKLFEIYLHIHDYFGCERSEIMKRLKNFTMQTKGGL